MFFFLNVFWTKYPLYELLDIYVEMLNNLMNFIMTTTATAMTTTIVAVVIWLFVGQGATGQKITDHFWIILQHKRQFSLFNHRT